MIKNKVIGPGKPKGVSKSPWERKIRKNGRRYPRKANGPRMPKRKINGTYELASNVIKSPKIILSH